MQGAGYGAQGGWRLVTVGMVVAMLAVPLSAQDSMSVRPHTTGTQRVVLGMTFGVAGGLLAYSAVRGRNTASSPRWPFPVGYTVGSYVGVVLAERAREGATPLATLLGTIAGAGIGYLAFSAMCDANSGDGGCLVGGMIGAPIFIISVPLGGSLGHHMSRR